MLRRSSLLVLGALGACAVLAACGGSKDSVSGFGDGGAGSSSGGGSGSGGSSGGSGSGSGGVLGGSGSSSGGGTTDGCSDAAKLVYVLSQENDLYSFDPPAKKFTKIGALGCQTTMTPNSMAVSRDAVAWVNYVEQNTTTGTVTNGGIFKVSTADASCKPTTIQLPQQWYHLGMGYSTDAAGSTNETLFIAATGSGSGLAKLDVNAGTVGPIGAFTGSLAKKDAELTGSGDGRLYGFFVPDPTQITFDTSVQVGEIAKASAATSNVQTMTGITPPSAWAFSFWGGDFYLYTWSTEPNGSTVTRYRPSDGSITPYMTGVGFTIVGAGVSTCAPTVPPK